MKSYFELLLSDVKKMSFKEHFFYWILPAVLLSILMVFYFSGVPVLVEIVCPKENWEWGILENIQLAIILAMMVLSFYAFPRKKVPIQKWGFFLIGLFALFVFLEEIDYGAHFDQLIGGEEGTAVSQYIPERNIHNRGNNAKLFKRSIYFVMALIFVIAPFLKSKFKNPYILYLIPSPRIVIVAILSIVSDLVPRLIVVLEILPDGGLGVNIGEFSEVMVYYIFLIYLIQLIFVNQLEVIGTTKTHDGS